MIAAPSVSAGHWALYYDGVSASPGTTHEPDHVSVDASWSLLHGRANRVSHGIPGDGGLFVDARLARSTVGPWVFEDDLLAPAFGRDGFLLPGDHAVSAWFGDWLDKDADGIIDDLRTADCAPSCSADEFAWRGSVSGHAASVYHITLDGVPPRRELLFNYSSESGVFLNDATATDHGWSGSANAGTRDAFITTIQTVTVANARPAIAGRFPIDIDDPAALTDVDRYQAVSGDVESLYISSRLAVARDATGAYQGVNAAIASTANAALTIFNAAVTSADNETRDSYNGFWNTSADALVIAGSAYATTTSTVFGARNSLSSTTAPPYPREPNTAEDDFEGRAFYGGVGDLEGSYNTYPGYATEHHLYFDNLARRGKCFDVYIAVPATAISTKQDLFCADTASNDVDSRNVDPLGGSRTGERSTGHLLTFVGRHFLWKDTNADTWVGKICGSERYPFDAERNTCPWLSPYGWRHVQDQSEVIQVCAAIRASMRASASVITLTPMDGNWGGAVFMRDYSSPTRQAYDLEWEILTDDAPVTLRWDADCAGDTSVTQDAVFFPAGTPPVPIRVEARASIASYADLERGVSLGGEYVIDVDILPAAL